MKKLLLLLFFFALALYHAQENDTIVVYEDVIEYDTVYVKKGGIVINPREQRPGKRRKKRLKITDFGGIVYGGVKDINFFSALGSHTSLGTGFGFWYQRSILFPELSVSVGANLLFWPQNFEINALESDTFLNGFYFTETNQPVLFQQFSNQHTEISLPLKFNYTWNNFTPFAGFFANYTTFKMQFRIPEDQILNKRAEFKSKNFNYGYTAGIRYTFERLHLSLEYQQYEFLEMNFKNKEAGNLNLKIKNGFLDQKLLLGIHYSFK